jgi:hypothetical protein
MSKVLYIGEAMSYNEKSAWAIAGSLLIVSAWYLTTLANEAGGAAVATVEYRGLVLVGVVLLAVLATVTHIVLAVSDPGSAGVADERDRRYNQLGEYVGGFVLGSGTLLTLGLAVIEADHFWIGNAILAALVLSELTSLGTRILLYRRGGLV